MLQLTGKFCTQVVMRTVKNKNIAHEHHKETVMNLLKKNTLHLQYMADKFTGLGQCN